MIRKFQALIGRMATRQIDSQEITLDQFQALIGRMATSVQTFSSLTTLSFQALIGRMATGGQRTPSPCPPSVSSPHR